MFIESESFFIPLRLEDNLIERQQELQDYIHQRYHNFQYYVDFIVHKYGYNYGETIGMDRDFLRQSLNVKLMHMLMKYAYITIPCLKISMNNHGCDIYRKEKRLYDKNYNFQSVNDLEIKHHHDYEKPIQQEELIHFLDRELLYNSELRAVAYSLMYYQNIVTFEVYSSEIECYHKNHHSWIPIDIDLEHNNFYKFMRCLSKQKMSKKQLDKRLGELHKILSRFAK